MNPLTCGTMLGRFLALDLWLMASVCLVLQVVDWMRVRAATPESWTRSTSSQRVTTG